MFQERLLKTRQNAKLNFKELSEKSGVSATLLSSYEKGLKSPTLESALKLATALNVSLDWLCGINQQTDTDSGDNTVLLITLMNFFDEFQGELSHKSKLCLTLTSTAYSFLEEYSKIRELSRSTDLMTTEMSETLKKALVEKYKDKPITLLQEVEAIPEEDLPF